MIKNTFKDLCSIKTGKLDANAAVENGAYPFFTCSKEPLKIDTYAYDCDCILLAGNGEFNVNIYSGKFNAYQRTYIIQVNDSEKTSLKYLFYLLKHSVAHLKNVSTGGVIKFIKLGNIQSITVPEANVKMQHKISMELDRLQNAIDLKKQQLSSLDDLVKSRFIEMFGDPISNPLGWEKVALSDVAEIKIGPFGSLLHKEDYIEHGHPLVNPSHIIDSSIATDSKLTISDSKYAELSSYHLKAGDVVLGRRGEMGRCAVVKKDGMLCGTGSLIIRANKDVTSEFIQNIISFPTYKEYIEGMAIGQTMLNLNVPIVSNLQIIKPPLDVQKQYYDLVELTDKSKFIVQKQIEDLQELLDSKMDEYFG